MTSSPDFLRFCRQDPSRAIADLQGVDANQQAQLVTSLDLLNRTPLWYASYYGHHLLVAALIAAGADVNHPMPDEFFPIYVAAYYGHHLVVELLLAAGAMPNQKCRSGVSPLEIASKRGHLLVVQSLLSRLGPDFPDELAVSLVRAAEHGHVSVIEILLSAGANPCITGKSLLHWVCQRGLQQLVERILSIPGVNIDAVTPDGETALLLAAAHDQPQVVDILLRQGADPNIADHAGYYPLHWVCQRGQYQLVERILSIPGVNINAVTRNEKTALLLAAENDHPQVVDILLRQGADPNIADHAGYYPLHLVSKRGQHQLVERILSIPGVNIDAVTPAGKTALLLAAENDHLQVVDILLRQGADPNIADKYGNYPLNFACSHDRPPLVEVFLAAAADEIAASNGRYLKSPLLSATAAGQLRIVQTLLAAGANPTPLDLEDLVHCALRNTRDHIFQFLCVHPRFNLNRDFLFHAVESSSEHSVEILLAIGADPLLKTPDGRSLVELALHPPRSLRVVENLLAAGVAPQLSVQRSCGNSWEAEYWHPKLLERKAVTPCRC